MKMYKSNILFVVFQVSFILSISAQKRAEILDEYAKNPSASILPNFSYVGYHHGEKAIPDVKAKVFDVTKFGAIPNDAISDKQAIEKTIAEATKNGGGIVYFPKGRFLINEDGDNHTPIKINCSNIVFRGSGAGKNGTELFMKNKLDPADPAKMWTTPSMIQFNTSAKNINIGQVVSPAAKGSFNIEANNVKDLKAGDWIYLEMKSTDPNLLKYEIGDLKADDTWTYILNEGVHVKVVHQVKSVSNNTLTLVSPIIYPIDPKHKWEVYKYSHNTEVGIEEIAFVGNWKDKFVHHGSATDDSGWSLIQFSKTTNSWIRNTRFTDVNVAVQIGGGANISVLNCLIDGNPGHEAIFNLGATNVLLGNLVDKAGMWHSYGVNGFSTNTVLYNVTYPPTTCFESHSSQPRNTLLDNVTGGLLSGRAGGALFNMPNHLSGLVFWNYKQTNEAVSNFDFWPTVEENKWWRMPFPILVGYHGANTSFVKSHLKYAESMGERVNPSSLYEAQLLLRLGQLPQWLTSLKSE
ncbi:MAG TPA: DUF4955 domain-containing protein [Sediminibacterium sp.]|uniref:DUF4955 domain-containing protein n=1 Tax=Sediminibacterium sp. TaxID=1917865 RepID=UPI002690303B|nr:DUF4955 domain-containing protein [Sediminibacterium sp.]HLD54247.1 DUF4955 domain-containing protein [Sediminibacterium sp.]